MARPLLSGCALTLPLLLLLAAPADAPTAAASSEQLTDLPVEWLTVPQLEAQSRPVEAWGSVPASHTLLWLGVAATVLGAVLIPVTLFTAKDWGPAIVGFGLAGHFMFSGALLGNLGGAVLPRVITLRDREQRRAAASRRLAELRNASSTMVEPPPTAVVDEYLVLKDRRPGLGVPGALLAAATAFTVIGLPLFATQMSSPSGRGRNEVIFSVSVGFLCAALAAAGLGLWRTIEDVREREDIDARLAELERQR